MPLRPYQEGAVAALWRWFRVHATGAAVLVLPTGSGKSHLIAAIARAVCERSPSNRVLVLAHRKELLEQNADKIKAAWPEGAVGLYSAGLGRRETKEQVIVAGIQSAHRRAGELGRFCLALIDEAHLVRPDEAGMYRNLLADLTAINPRLRLAGFTATPYRLGHGTIVDADGLFTGVAYEAPILDLVEAGYLSPLVSKTSRLAINLAGVRTRAGEFVATDLEEAFDQDDLVARAVTEIEQYGHDRKSWLVFCCGVDHSEHVAAELRKRGHGAECVTGKTMRLFRDQHIERFKRGEIKCLVNCEVLTTGFDHPGIDLIAVLRPTKSATLWVQMCGRGSRVAPGKKDCVVLDFGGNARRHGPIDLIRHTVRRNPLTDRDEWEIEAPAVKVCVHCNSVIQATCRQCPDCGNEIPVESREPKHAVSASSAPILSNNNPPQVVKVLSVDFKRHNKMGKPPSLKVIYTIEGDGWEPLSQIAEWVCLEHFGYARDKAVAWWLTRNPDCSVPDTIDEALEKTSELRTPTTITVRLDGQYWRVLQPTFDDKAEKELRDFEDQLYAAGYNI